MRLLLLLSLVLSHLISQAEDTPPSENDGTVTQERIIFTKDQQLPEKLYVNQIFAVTVDAIIAEDVFDSINTEFGTYYGLDILTKHPTWYLKEQNTFSLTYYLRVYEKYLKIPDLDISVTLDDRQLDRITQKGPKARSHTIQPNNKFCQVVAEELTITNHKIDKYDEDLNIFVLEMESRLGNLEDFSLPFVRDEGIDWSSIELPVSKVFYYGIIPNNMEHLEFNYFRPSTGEFKKVEVTFDFSKFGQKTSTQIEINPNKKSFPYLKVLLITTFILILVLLYIWRKNPVFLILALLVSAYTVYMLRDKSIRVKEGAKVYLLPTKHSSIFFTTQYPIATEMIKQRDGYYKIMLPDDKIGWVKEDDVYQD
jgi:hypothetical protein